MNVETLDKMVPETGSVTYRGVDLTKAIGLKRSEDGSLEEEIFFQEEDIIGDPADFRDTSMVN